MKITMTRQLDLAKNDPKVWDVSLERDDEPPRRIGTLSHEYDERADCYFYWLDDRVTDKPIDLLDATFDDPDDFAKSLWHQLELDEERRRDSDK